MGFFQWFGVNEGEDAATDRDAQKGSGKGAMEVADSIDGMSTLPKGSHMGQAERKIKSSSSINSANPPNKPNNRKIPNKLNLTCEILAESRKRKSPGFTDDGDDQPFKKIRVLRSNLGKVNALGDVDDLYARSAWNCERSSSNILDILQGQISRQLEQPRNVSEDNICDQDAILAIAAVWQGLQQMGPSVSHSFGDLPLLRHATMGRCEPPQSDGFIMPLRFAGPDMQNTGDASEHVVLAIASPLFTRGPEVHFRFMYPEPTTEQNSGGRSSGQANHQLTKEVIRNRAIRIVQCSDWRPNGNKPSFNIENEIWVTVPKLTSGSTSRYEYHLVLNAWAYLLDIPIVEVHARPAGLSECAFYDQVRRLMNLALDGRLTLGTVRLFLQSTGYGRTEEDATKHYSLKADERQAIDRIRSVLMNSSVLGMIMKEGTEKASEKFPTRLAPSVASLSTILSISSDEAEPSTGESRLSSSQPTETWMALFNRNLAQFGTYARTEKRAKKTAIWKDLGKDRYLQMPGYDTRCLDDSEVTCAIGSLWNALYEQGMEYGFGTPAAFLANRDLDNSIGFDMPVVGGPNPLIMPLFFTFDELSWVKLQKEKDEKKAKSKGRATRATRPAKAKPGKKLTKAQEEAAEESAAGHILLVVAEEIPLGSRKIRLSTYDSSWGSIDADDIQLAARNIAQHSGWLGLSTDDFLRKSASRPSPPLADIRSRRVKSPSQTRFNVCGFYTILNAWARMLELEVVAGGRRNAKKGSEDEFLRQGYRMVQLALQGQMDSRTAQAFFNAYGYTRVAQDIADPRQDVVALRFSAMNPHRLAVLVERRLGREWGLA